MSYAQETLVDSIRQASTFNTQSELAEILRRRGISFKNLGKYDKADVCYKASLVISQQIGDSIAIGAVLNSLALFYSKKGENSKALQFFYRAIKINKRIKYKKGLIDNYLNLGNFFFYQKNFGTHWGDCPIAEQYYRRCLSIPLYPAMTKDDVRKLEIILNRKLSWV